MEIKPFGSTKLCPKCGWITFRRLYHDTRVGRARIDFAYTKDEGGEHLHIECLGCKWSTIERPKDYKEEEVESERVP